MGPLFVELNAVALALYIVAAVCYGAELSLRSPQAPSPYQASSGNGRIVRFGRISVALGVLTQIAATGNWCIAKHVSPFAGEYGTLSNLSWIMALAFLGLDVRYRMPAVGAVALPPACLILFWGLLHVGGPVGDVRLLNNRIVSLHVLTILASYALFALAFGCAGLYLVQHRLLKVHRVHSLLRPLPPLSALDRVAYLAVAYALPLLTIGLLLGIAYVLRGVSPLPTSSWLLDPHNLVSFATWILYVFYLMARLVLGWRGIRLQYILVLGLFVALALYVLPTSTHRFEKPRSEPVGRIVDRKPQLTSPRVFL